MPTISVVVFFVVTLAVNLLTAYAAGNILPYFTSFSYFDILELKYKYLPKFISSFANFDGVHYVLIADSGYFHYQETFFPLYPLFIRYLSPIFGNDFIVSGLVISNLCFIAGIFVFIKYLQKFLSSKLETVGFWTVLFLLTFPTSFFFNSLYTEGLFFLLFISSLYLFEKKRYLPAAVLSFLTALTRLTGIFLIIPFAIRLFQTRKQKKSPNTKYLILNILAPIAGLLSYSFYLWKAVGVNDPLAFIHYQSAFNANRSAGKIITLPQVIYRYFKIFITAAPNYQYFISLLEFVVFFFILTLLILDLIKSYKNKSQARIGLNLFSLANLILPTMSGTLSSIPRYALMSISAFIYLGEIKSKTLKISLAVVFFILRIILLGMFIQGYFVS